MKMKCFFPVVEEVETDELDEQPIQLRRSERILEQKRKNAIFTIQTEQYKDPENVEEALCDPDSQHWQDAMNEEYYSLIQNCTLKLVDFPKYHNAI